ncbi:MAG TPA: S-adenosylmethionine:tRNA ribosyltransferase-isomerase, partial [Syntrophomonas sp.]|nr:S-adenosylmethionine:tRNA ribosyltransferase-isomerase [Syntrophomonas sp.]
MNRQDLSPLYNLQRYMFDLPPYLIAQYPVEPRDSARLLVVDRTAGKLEDRVFTDIIDFFSPGDTLVINQTK